MFPFLLSLYLIFMIFHFLNGFSCFHLDYCLVDLFYIYIHSLLVVPHKAVAEVSKIEKV